MENKVKPVFGISVYPDISSMEEIKNYMELAAKYGISRVFSSMFSVEGTKEEVLDYFRVLIEHAHKFDLKVDLDVNPMLFERVDATVDDLSVFADIGVDVLRMDFSYGAEGDLKLVNNPYGILIEFNSSFTIVDDLLKKNADVSKFLVCHNFYPQRYTGLSWDRFLKTNQEIKALGNIRIGAFISSNAKNTHGVWGAKDGLPTVEKLRGLPLDLQARILLATGNVDDILIGNAYASEDEFKSLQEIMKEVDTDWDNPITKLLIDYGIIDLEKAEIRKFKMILEEDISDLEKEIIYDFYPHMSFVDTSEWMWRSRMPRFVYSDPKYVIGPRACEKEYFEYGDVVMVNDNYKHYAGELQIVLLPMENDGQRNLIGRLADHETMMLDLLKDTDIMVFIE